MANLYIENEVVSVKNSKQIRSKYPLNLVGSGANGSINATGTVNALTAIVDVTTATATLTSTQSGSAILLDRAAGSTITLPADAVGLTYTFVVATTVTSTSYKVIIATASSFFTGAINVPVAAGTAKLFYGDGSTLLSVNLNGTTTGGLQGGWFTVTCLKSGLWLAEGDIEGSGTVATPFATS